MTGHGSAPVPLLLPSLSPSLHATDRFPVVYNDDVDGVRNRHQKLQQRLRELVPVIGVREDGHEHGPLSGRGTRRHHGRKHNVWVRVFLGPNHTFHGAAAAFRLAGKRSREKKRRNFKSETALKATRDTHTHTCMCRLICLYEPHATTQNTKTKKHKRKAPAKTDKKGRDGRWSRS